jgi:hypothetical protein
MSKLKQMQLNIAHLIDNLEDQEALVRMYLDVKTGGAKAMLDAKNTKTIVDLKSIYGVRMDKAVNIFIDMERNNLTDGKDVPTETNQESECGK